LGVAASAQAVPILRLTTSSGAQTVADGDGADVNPTTGAVTLVHADAQWIVNVATGLSKPLLGSPDAPELDLNSVNMTSTGGGWIEIELTDTGFTAQDAATVFASLGGTTSGAVSYKTYFDPSNTAFGKVTELTSVAALGPAFAHTAGNTLSSAGLYSLTLLVRITHAGQQASSFDAAVKVPEPGTLLLLGAGCVVLAAVKRRRGLRQAEAA
jgi:hypothetical protein